MAIKFGDRPASNFQKKKKWKINKKNRWSETFGLSIRELSIKVSLSNNGLKQAKSRFKSPLNVLWMLFD